MGKIHFHDVLEWKCPAQSIRVSGRPGCVCGDGTADRIIKVLAWLRAEDGVGVAAWV